MEVNIFNIKGEETGRKVILEDSVFRVEPNDYIVYLDVRRYLANKRQGTAKSKERSEMSGSTRKLGRQKGSGGARRGDINSPVLVGGARVFGPKPRDYSFKLNKKEKKMARRSVLSCRMREGGVIVVEDFSFETPKTKEFLDLAKNLKIQIANSKLLVILPEKDDNIFLSARNISKVKVTTVSNLNTYEILDVNRLVILESSVVAINNF
ncbi:MAG: 50S ribosomal protein L4 [Candidatus Azobacteroides pseudotrichonymphae]|jgi:large subunit ribosomal protein L4|uniref:Large ribosomal subunit protein uL4 n=1 Tax=Azobacteroides pseudotrichonymphae genomovar. CFP2 TaxID=511995 RepID=RL4_AZOPC|nr:50S ribosomal protein L4 [Candidatus Azobacteroides pseudotrichonymphae]B6YQ84.1 RecName: Full=Large ribosomal subunit protein uL4; AltName: Full=50S ribosomal protein L4 [Candidatus Azobacteroides pseudotrichonymphae genomovar. CFP2]MDR0530149.1 50S ribosomal protein L4 [Bacteroidales bacterium OttesenSCG-928-I14]BAG83356.1 50S ribosomal protein L4 [Candidatus Azobacteroides pseudotrichonymphae genomovar. CFP2]GMO36864.1 MAG: 50S ribosomal protein L4 [Candidatus Azobacteroides pseudotrichon